MTLPSTLLSPSSMSPSILALSPIVNELEASAPVTLPRMMLSPLMERARNPRLSTVISAFSFMVRRMYIPCVSPASPASFALPSTRIPAPYCGWLTLTVPLPALEPPKTIFAASLVSFSIIRLLFWALPVMVKSVPPLICSTPSFPALPVMVKAPSLIAKSPKLPALPQSVTVSAPLMLSFV